MAKTTKARPLEDDVSDPVTMAYFQYAHLAAGLRVAQRAVGEAEDHLMRIAQDQSGITYPRVTYDPELRKVVVTNDRPQKAPVSNGREEVESLVDDEARERGFDNWIAAYQRGLPSLLGRRTATMWVDTVIMKDGDSAAWRIGEAVRKAGG